MITPGDPSAPPTDPGAAPTDMVYIAGAVPPAGSPAADDMAPEQLRGEQTDAREDFAADERMLDAEQMPDARVAEEWLREKERER